jgi:hypothetical protein
MRQFVWLIISSILVVFPIVAIGQGLVYVGETLYDGPFYSIQKVGDYLYCYSPARGNFSMGITQIHTLNDSLPPRFCSYFDFKFFNMQIVGDYAYSASGDSGLQILNIHDPINPQRIGSLPIKTDFITVVGNYAYTIERNSGLHIVNITDPLDPFITGTFASFEIFHVLINGDYAYIAALDSGLQIIDISNPYSPSLMTTIHTQYLANFVSISDNYIFLSTYFVQNFPPYNRIGNLATFYMADPINLLEIGNYQMDGKFSSKCKIRDNKFYVQTASGLDIFDMSDPANLVQLGTYNNHDFMNDFFLDNNLVFISGGYPTLCALDFSNPINPSRIWEFEPGRPASICVVDSLAYVGNDYYGSLKILNIRNPYHPAIIGDWVTGGVIRTLALSENYIYLADGGGGGLEVIDISNPTNPQKVWDNDRSSGIRDIAISDSFAFLAYTPGTYHGIKCVNISNPSNPIPAGYYDVSSSGGCFAIEIKNNYAYVIDTRIGLLIIDFSNPSNPILVGMFSIIPSMAIDVTVQNELAFISVWETGLLVVDVSIPSNPILVGQCSLPRGASAIKLSGRYCYINSELYGLQVVDISDPTHPNVIAQYETPSLALDLAIKDDYVYIADYTSLIILSTPFTGIPDESVRVPLTFSVSPNYPNPFNTSTTIKYSLPSASNVSIDIYEITGRKIKTIFSEKQNAGEYSVVWNARDVPSGVYLYRIKTDNQTISKKCLLLK